MLPDHGGARPAGLSDYQGLLRLVKKGLEREEVAEERSKLFQRLIHRIEIGTDRVKIHYHAGQQWIKMGFEGKNRPSNPIFLKINGSRTCQNGWGGRIRTYE